MVVETYPISTSSGYGAPVPFSQSDFRLRILQPTG
jgi:hypothetical protein